VQVGEYASTYGFVMRGATSENALSVYEAQAREFTGYWAGTQDLDTAMTNITAAMTDLLQ
jgi:multiple sugar transport system substrate-binding protein